MKEKKKILKELQQILENKKITENHKISELELFDSLIVLQIISYAKKNFNKSLDGRKVLNSKKISDVVNLIIE